MMTIGETFFFEQVTAEQGDAQGGKARNQLVEVGLQGRDLVDTQRR